MQAETLFELVDSVEFSVVCIKFYRTTTCRIPISPTLQVCFFEDKCNNTVITQTVIDQGSQNPVVTAKY